MSLGDGWWASTQLRKSLNRKFYGKDTLPLDLSSKKYIMEISNKIGKLYYVDEDFVRLLDKIVARFLIEVDYSRGLMATMDIYWGLLSIHKQVDY